MQVGTVKAFDRTKHFGFIEAENGRQYFVHQTGILMDGVRVLLPGTPVEFRVGRDEKGRIQAVDVRPF